MSLDDYLTRVPDDDPEGEHQDEDRCPDCLVGPEEPCLPTCACAYCRERDRRAQSAGTLWETA